MDERIALLENWGLSPALVRLAAGALPHRVFRFECEAIQPEPSGSELGGGRTE